MPPGEESSELSKLSLIFYHLEKTFHPKIGRPGPFLRPLMPEQLSRREAKVPLKVSWKIGFVEGDIALSHVLLSILFMLGKLAST